MSTSLELRLAELEAENATLKVELQAKKNLAARALASYQERALQMEVIRQQNEDLDRVAQQLILAKKEDEERSRQLEEAARLKSEFLANFSHEIRTPLNGILGYCDLLMREEGSRLTPHGRRDLNVVKSNAKTLLALINDILDLSKIEAGRVDILKEPFELRPMVEECIATVTEVLRGKDVSLSAHVEPAAETVVSDSLKVKQILLNLLSNAAKFTDSGEIVVEARAEGNALVLSVEDTGPGIPEDEQQHIFDKFRQVDGSSARKVGGTGLGLAIVREVSHILGGDVTVKSSFGRGSRFTVRLEGALAGEGGAAVPRALTPRPAGDYGAEEGGKAATVLVIDDDPLIVNLLERALSDSGFRVVTAGDGVTGVVMARKIRPTAIILDIHLPKLDGWGVLGELKGDPSLSSIPVLILSIEEERSKGFAFGACDYLLKPVDLDHLVLAVRRALGTKTGEVLVVDDDPSAREMVVRGLRAAGFRCVEAHDGEDALLKARLVNPSLLILDLIMPRMDGFEVLSAFRKSSEAPVIVLTGKSLSPKEESDLRNGLAHVVKKGGVGMDMVVSQAKALVSDQRAAARRQARVLYVEDSPQNRDIVRRYLYGTYEVIEAEDGEHGLERAKRDMPDIILMDLGLPRIDGLETTRRIRATPVLSHIPVIALTAHVSREDEEKARAAGCIDYLTKPVDREVLLSTLRRHLNHG